MKKLFYLILSFSLLLTGCSSKTSSMSKTVKQMFNYLKKEDYEKAGSLYVEEIDFSSLLQLSEDTELEKEVNVIIKDSVKHLKYKITDSSIDEDDNNKGEVSVTLSTYNLTKLSTDYASNVLDYTMHHITSALSEDSDEQYAEILKDSYKDFDKSNINKVEMTFNMVKKDNKWLIDNDANDLVDAFVGNLYDQLKSSN